MFHGVASVAGWGPHAFTPTCINASAAIPAFVGHGTSDAVVAHSDGLASRDFWRDRNGCGAGTMPSLDGCITYQDCRAGLPVAYCEHSGDHVIPSSTGTKVWAFFSSLD